MKQYLLNIDEALWEELRTAAKQTDSTVAAYIRRACKIHIHMQKKHLAKEIEKVNMAKRNVEDKFFEAIDNNPDEYTHMII